MHPLTATCFRLARSFLNSLRLPRTIPCPRFFQLAGPHGPRERPHVDAAPAAPLRPTRGTPSVVKHLFKLSIFAGYSPPPHLLG